MLHSSQRVGRDLATKQQHAGAARDRQTEDRASSRPANDKRAYHLHKVWWDIAKRKGWGNSHLGDVSAMQCLQISHALGAALPLLRTTHLW